MCIGSVAPAAAAAAAAAAGAAAGSTVGAAEPGRALTDRNSPAMK